MAKHIKIGSLRTKDQPDGSKSIFLGLGEKNKDPKYKKYDISVEVIVRNALGKIISQQTDGFITLVDPRTEADELLSKQLISEADADKMRERGAKTPENVRYHLKVRAD